MHFAACSVSSILTPNTPENILGLSTDMRCTMSEASSSWQHLLFLAMMLFSFQLAEGEGLNGPARKKGPPPVGITSEYREPFTYEQLTVAVRTSVP